MNLTVNWLEQMIDECELKYRPLIDKYCKDNETVCYGVQRSDDIGSDGLSKQQWYQRCEKYSEAKFSCATAANISKCTEIRMGSYTEFGMAQVYCNGNEPNFSLMGRK